MWPRGPRRSASGIALPEHPTGAHLDRHRHRQHLAAPDAGAGVQRQHRPFELRRVHVRPRPQARRHVQCRRQHCHIAYADPADTNSAVAGIGLRRISPATRTAMAASGAAARCTCSSNLKLADNAIGFTHAARRCRPRRPIRRGSSTRCSWARATISAIPRRRRKSPTAAACRTTSPDFPIRGYEYYDYRHDVVNTTFVNFEPNATRDAGAISYLMFTSFGMSTENSVEGAEIRQRQAGRFPAGRAPLGVRFRRQRRLAERGDP